MIDVLALIRETIAYRYLLREMPEITSETDLDEIEYDPLDRLCLAYTIEEKCGVELPEATVSGWVTVTDVEACVRGIEHQSLKVEGTNHGLR